MRKSAKIITALSVAGLAVAAGSAFTGTGVTSSAGATQFVGGTVSQAVSGATLTDVTYGFDDPTTKNLVSSITLTFADGANGKAVAAALSGGTGGSFNCGTITLNASNCTFVEDPATTGVTETGYTGLTSLAVTVSNPV